MTTEAARARQQFRTLIKGLQNCEACPGSDPAAKFKIAYPGKDVARDALRLLDVAYSDRHQLHPCPVVDQRWHVTRVWPADQQSRRRREQRKRRKRAQKAAAAVKDHPAGGRPAGEANED